jgi:hypothetical protein
VESILPFIGKSGIVFDERATRGMGEAYAACKGKDSNRPLAKSPPGMAFRTGRGRKQFGMTALGGRVGLSLSLLLGAEQSSDSMICLAVPFSDVSALFMAS